MRKQIKLAIFFLSLWTSSLGAENIKVYEPTVKEVDFGKDEADWNRIHKRLQQVNWDEDKLTPAERKLNEKFGIWEGSNSYWSTIDGGDGWYEVHLDTIIASSSLKNQGKYTYNASNVHDYSLKSIWSEGVKGQGIGEYLLFKFEGNSPRVSTITITNGCAQSKALYEANSRVKKLKVYYNDKPVGILNLKDIRGYQTFETDTFGLGHEGVKPWSLKLEIMEVYPGTKYDDTVITEINLEGPDKPLCFVKGSKVKMADGSNKEIELIKKEDKIAIPSTNGQSKSATVKSVAKAIHDKYVTYNFANGQKLSCTPDHVLVSTRGNVSSAPEQSKQYSNTKEVQKIKIGDTFLIDGKTTALESITESSKSEESYTITELSEGDEFIVNGVIVKAEMRR